MKLLYFLRKITPNFIQNIIKYIYMKWNISWNMCKIAPLEYLINKQVKIGKYIKVWKQDYHIEAWVEIWDYTWLNSRIQFYSSKESKVIIWKFCSIWYWVAFIANMRHNYDCLTTSVWDLRPNDFKDPWKTIILGNDVRVGRNAIIMKWVNIWTWAVIWAWSVVTKDIPPYAIAVWNPAKVIKYRFDEKTIKKLLESERRNRDIEKIKKNYNLEFIKDKTKN